MYLHKECWTPRSFLAVTNASLTYLVGIDLQKQKRVFDGKTQAGLAHVLSPPALSPFVCTGQGLTGFVSGLTRLPSVRTLLLVIRLDNDACYRRWR